MLKHLIIDNVLLNPNSISEWARRCDYLSLEESIESNFHKKFTGYRSVCLQKQDKPLLNNTINNIIERILNSKYFNAPYQYDYQIDAYFTYLPSTYTHDENFIVREKSLFTAVIFLNETPNKNSGLLIYNDKRNLIHAIANRYNRLVLFNSGYSHSAEGGFGENINNARLTLVINFKGFLMSAKS